MNWNNWFRYRPTATMTAPPGGKVRLELDELEKRILMSATPLGYFEADLAESPGAENDGADTTDWDTSLFTQLDAINEELARLDAGFIFTDPSPESGDSQGEPDSTTDGAFENCDGDCVTTVPIQLVFIDADLDDLEQLLQSIDTQQGNVAIVQLNADDNGIQQITEYLQQSRHSVSAIHLVSHGQAGQVQLGSEALSDGNLQQYEDQIRSWGNYLTAEADILIYGCDVGASDSGQHLLDGLAQLTGADIAASDDATGHEMLGGDWELEMTSGTIDTGIVFTSAVEQNWYSTLDITSGLVLNNTFDTDGSDSSGNNYDGTLTNGASIDTSASTSQVGGKVSLDGDNDYVDLSSHAASFDSLSEGTLSAWIYTGDSIAGYDVIFEASDSGDWDSRLALIYDAFDQSLIFYINDNSATHLHFETTAGSITEGAWTHVAVTVDGSGNKAFINGVQQTGLTYFSGSASTRRFFSNVQQIDFVGWGVDKYNTSTFGGHFDGFIDEGRVYSRALSSSDIGDLYARHDGLTVDTTSDIVDGNTSNVATLLANKGADGFISLREAIIAINNDSETGWRINLDSGTYSLSRAGDGEDFASTGDLDINSSITIAGSGAATTIIDGSSMADRLFEVTGSGSLMISNVTLTGGSGDVYAGGAISNAGVLSVQDVVFIGNETGNSDGGAIYSSGSTTLDRVAVVNNTSGANGGGIHVQAGTLELSNATISGNTSVYNGAGIDARNGGTLINISHSTIANNQTTTSGNGGGLYVSSATVNVSYSIFADNLSQFNGFDITGAIVSGGYNIIEANNGFSGTVSTDILGSDPGLAVLTQVGGTYVHTISTASIAYQAAASSGETVDQRGVARDSYADIGSYEFVASGQTTFYVYNTDDSGAGSLRQAIIDANTNSGTLDTIEFNIAGSGPHTIYITTELPEFSDAIIVDGWSEPDYAGDGIPVIVIDGTGTGAGVDGLTLGAGSDGSTIRGLVIQNMGDDGIQVSSDNNWIYGNFIGVAVSGLAAPGNTGDGIFLVFGASGNRIGTNDDGTNDGYERNVIGGNLSGVRISGAGSDNNVVAGNYIGVGTDGLTIVANTDCGVSIENGAATNTIGGSTVDLGNIISGNGSHGIQIDGENSDSNLVQNNWIGVSADGLSNLGNGGDGINIYGGSDGNQLLDNWIAGSAAVGIHLDSNGVATSSNIIKGNRIGTDAAGTLDWGSGENGILLESGSNNNTIGGTGSGEGNIIAFSGSSTVNDAGIVVLNGATGNTIRGNSLYGNGIGIDLSASATEDDVTANDAGDSDSGGNNLQNWAAIYSASINGAGVLSYGLNTTTLATGTYTIDFYASTDLNGGAVEGRRYLGSVSGVADGNATLTGSVSGVTLSAGEYVTIVTTDGSGNSSEFSSYVVATSNNVAPVTSNMEASALSYTENAGAVTITSTLSLSDADDTNLESAVVQITSGYASGQDQLLFTDQNGIVGSYNSTTGTLTLSGTATVAQYEAAIRSIAYSNISDSPDTTTRTVSITVNDGDSDSNTVTRDIAITAVNDAPILTPYGPTLSLSEDGSPYAATIGALLGTSVTDPDSGAVEGIAIFGLTLDGGTLEYSLDGTNWTTVSGVSSSSALLLRDTDYMRFTPSSVNGGTTLIQYHAWDQTSGISGATADVTATGGSTAFSTATDTVTVNVSSVNDDPTNAGSLPTDVSVTEDVATAIDLSALDFSDVDAGSSSLTVTLSTSTGGDLIFAADGSLVFDGPFFGGSTKVWSISGTLADLNSYFNNTASIQYLHATSHTYGNDVDTITVVINDNGNTGSGGGSDQTLGTVNVDITAVNDAPQVGANTGTTVSEGGTVTITTAMLNENDVDDADTGLIYSVTSGPTNGQLELTTNSGVAITSFTQDDIDNNRLIFVHDGTQATTDSFDFSLADGGEDGATPVTGTFTFTVTNVNDPPVAGNIEGTALPYTENDGAVAVTSTITFTDVDDTDIESAVVRISGGYNSGEDVLSFIDQNGISGSFNSTTGILTLNGTATLAQYETAIRSITYTNTSENPDTTSRTVSFTVNDGDADSNAVTRDIAVGSVNDAPENAVPGTQVVLEETETGINGLSISDPDVGAANLTTRIEVSNGSLKVVLQGSAIISVGSNNSSGFTLLGSVGDINATLATLTYRGNVDVVGIGADTITMTTNDLGGSGTGGAQSDVDLIQIDITNVNDEEVLASNSGTTVFENSVNNTIDSSMLQTTDVDNTTSQLIYSITSDVSRGNLFRNGVALTMGSTFSQQDIDNGLITYSHNGSETSADSFSFVVDDQAGTTTSGTFSITITPVNDQTPIIQSDGAGDSANLTIAENQTAVTTVQATDADLPTQGLIYSIISGQDASHFQIDSGTGQLTFISGKDRESASDFNGDHVYEVVVQASDGTLADTQTIRVSIADVDEFDVGAIADLDSAAERVSENAAVGTTAGYTATAEDGDATNNSIIYSLTDNAGGRFAIDALTGQVTVAGALDYESATSHLLTVRATSSDGSWSEANITVQVENVDEFGVSSSIDLDLIPNVVGEHAGVGEQVGIRAFAFDSDLLDSVSYSLSNSAGGLFGIDSLTGTVTVAGPLDFELSALHVITIRATSSDGSFSDTDFMINVLDENDSPASIQISQDSIAENADPGAVVGQLTVDDQDIWDSHQFQIVGGTGQGVFTIDLFNRVVLNTNLDFETESQFTLVVRGTDLAGAWVEETLLIQVVDANDVPVAVDDHFTGAEDTPMTANVINGSDYDQDGDALVAQLISGPTHASQFQLNGDGSFTYQGVRDFFGDDQFQYRVFDGQNYSEVATVTLQLNSVNDAPVGVSDSYLMNQAETLEVLVNGVLNNDTDVDSGALIAIVVQQPTHGQLQFNSNGTFTYVPDKEFFGTDKFTYVPNDGSASGNVVQVQIFIAGLNAPTSPNTPGDGGTTTTNQDGVQDSGNSPQESLNDSDQADDDVPKDHPVPTVDANLLENRDADSNDRADAIRRENDVEESEPKSSENAEASSFALPTAREAAGVLSRMAQLDLLTDPLKLAELDMELRDLEGVSLAFDAGRLWNFLEQDGGEKDTNELESHTIFENSLVTGSIIATAGYVLWTLRGGVMVATMLTSLPSWKFVDPLPVLDSFDHGMEGDDSESLQSMLEHARQEYDS